MTHSTVADIDPVTGSPTEKFSALLRQSIRRPQCEPTASATAAILESAGFSPDQAEGEESMWAFYFGGLKMLARVLHPVSGEKDVLCNVIADLNDNERWSREQIADWLESHGL